MSQENKLFVDVDAKLERIKEFMEFSAGKLNLENTKINLILDEIGNQSEPCSFPEGLAQIVDMHKNRMFEISSVNGIRILNDMPKRLLDVKEKLDQKFEDLLELVDEQNDVIENLKDEVSLKETEVKEAQDRVEALKEEINNNKFDTLQNQINNLTNTIMQQNFKGTQEKHPDSYFSDPIEAPAGEPIEEETKDSKKENIQKCHEEILGLMKGEGLYPLHKVDVNRAKETYQEMWGFVIPNYPELTLEDYPSFIDNLEDFANEDDNYLDSVEAV